MHEDTTPAEDILADPAEVHATRDTEADALRATLAERDIALASGVEANRLLLERLRAAMLASEPAVAPVLVTGETLDELETSFAAARELVARIRDAVRQEEPAPVPAGAPGRARLQPRNAFEKIRSGLEQR